jgi:O-antigen biosynthesis protein
MDKKYIYEIKLNDDTAPAKILRLVKPNCKVLEIGCASGIQSRILTEHLGCKVTGIEINAEAAQDARQYCEQVIVGDIEQISLEEHLQPHRYDVIIFADVLEHLKDPARVLEKIMPFLSDIGYLLISVPNIVHSSVIMEMINGKFDYHKYGLLDDTHIKFYTKKTLYCLLEKSGYVITNLDRVVGLDCNTQYCKTPYTAEDRNILHYIQKNNFECDTFQFVIKAYKVKNGSNSIYSELLETHEKYAEIEKKLKEKNDDYKQLESQLKWLTDQRLYKAFSVIKHAITFFRGKPKQVNQVSGTMPNE